ncbi:MAG: outer membrane protein assembly factor BamC [Nitrosomonadales bacterium]|nr:outer membrane protein assembly factor BamC [Nitrosomonadales bacterium]
MKVLQIGLCCAAVIALAGCGAMGFGNKRIDYRAGATQAPSLEVPPDLSAPGNDDRYKVPQGNGESVATYSDYTKRGGDIAPRAAAVLPEVKGVHLERSGTQRWLVVNDKAENVWPVLKAFWQETGLPIKSEDQAAGVMETEWVENRAKIPQGGLRSVLGKVFDNIYSSGERDQYRARLERSKDGLSTEIYITHRGMEEVLSADRNTSSWKARANDPELEAIMLQRLMVRFGGNEIQATNALASNGAGETPGSASLQDGFDGNRIILVNDSFDKTWRRVGLAIESAGYAIEDKDRTKGIYFLRPIQVETGWVEKLKFWKDDQDSNKRYRVLIRDGGTACDVSVVDQNGAGDATTAKLIEAIHSNINQ